MSDTRKSTIIVGLTAALLLVVVALVIVNRPTERIDGAYVPITKHVPAKPDDVQRLANFGYRPDRTATRRFLQSLRNAGIREAAPGLFQQARADDQPVFLWRPFVKAYKGYYGKDWVVGRQGIGDCVSWGWAHAADMHLAVQFELGDTAKWKPAATEAIYGGSRVEANGGRLGGYQDGSYGSAAAKFVKNWGVVYRQNYPEIGVDLTKYSASRARQWGNFGNGGQQDNGRLDEIAKEHPITDVALVANFDEAAAAIASGYPVAVCSGQGFTSQRDAEGFCRASGTWWHCMTFCGARFGNRPGLLCLNSWGPDWVSGPKWPADQPEGSFWVDKSTVDRMLAGRDSFAVSGYVGFPYRDLQHADWVNIFTPNHSYALAP